MYTAMEDIEIGSDGRTDSAVTYLALLPEAMEHNQAEQPATLRYSQDPNTAEPGQSETQEEHLYTAMEDIERGSDGRTEPAGTSMELQPRAMEHNPAPQPATTGQRTSTTAFANRWKLCALLLIFVGLGLAFGAWGLYARLTVDRKDYHGVNHCASSPCQNGGECFPGLESFHCNCTSAFTGAYCQTDIKECSSSPCGNGGSCFDGNSSYQCACAVGYTGVHCEINTNECSPNPCHNGGSCTDDINSYQCTCAAGYTGVHCEININECSSSPCGNGGSCFDGNSSYQCACAVGYTGVHCEINTNECSPNPCYNGGSCTDGINMYQCACAAGYTGVHCEININECSSSPCGNGGLCFDGNSSYQCACAVGYTGVHCEINTNECSPNPCYNGGSCTDDINSYQCACAAGYTAVHCEININECSSNPCRNGGSCIDGSNSFHCACAVGYTGVHCEMTHRDCKEVRTAMFLFSGVYTVTPSGGTPTQVYCDMDTDGGGWLVFQKRVDGSVDFYRNWASYAAGFGDLNGEFWLGNRNLHLLTAQKSYTLRVVLSDWEGNQTYAQYMNFTIGSEQDKFRLTVGGYSGTAGASLSYQSGSQFSTRDQDNDVSSSLHCAQVLRGAWWYRDCSYSSLNGRYYPAGTYTIAQTQTGHSDGVWWYHWKGTAWYSLKSARMMIRPAP